MFAAPLHHAAAVPPLVQTAHKRRLSPAYRGFACPACSDNDANPSVIAPWTPAKTKAFPPPNANCRKRVLTARVRALGTDRKSTRLNSSHLVISYAVFCLKKKRSDQPPTHQP